MLHRGHSHRGHTCLPDQDLRSNIFGGASTRERRQGHGRQVSSGAPRSQQPVRGLQRRLGGNLQLRSIMASPPTAATARRPHLHRTFFIDSTSFRYVFVIFGPRSSLSFRTLRGLRHELLNTSQSHYYRTLKVYFWYVSSTFRSTSVTIAFKFQTENPTTNFAIL